MISRDAGQLTVRFSISFDVETGEFVGFEEEVLDQNGPHPIFFDGPPFDEVCRGLGGELVA